MYQRFCALLSRDVMLFRSSCAMLRHHPGLLIFPMLSSLALLALLGFFLVPLGGMHALARLSAGNQPVRVADGVLGLMFYFSLYFLIFFFNTALVGTALMELDGDKPTVADGLRLALSKIGPILGYTLIVATIGLLLSLLKERLKLVGRIVVDILGFSWAISTSLVVPILAWRDCGPLEAISQSSELIRETWGVSIAVDASAGPVLIFVAVLTAELLGGAALFSFARFTLHSSALLTLTEVIVTGAVALTALIYATLLGIYKAALFRYASGSGSTPGFDAEGLKQAFQAAT